jgi:hypothetical protein
MSKQYNYSPLKVYQLQYEGETCYNIEIKTGAKGFEQAEILFHTHGTLPDGEGWDGFITFLLEKENPDLLHVFDLDYVADTFIATCDRKADMITLADLLQYILMDDEKMEEYLKALPEEYKSVI